MHQVIRHLIFVPLNMRANIRRNSGWVGSRLLAQRGAAFAAMWAYVPFQPERTTAKPVSAGQTIRYAISEAEHDGNMAGGAYAGVRTLAQPAREYSQIACIRIPRTATTSSP